MRKYRIIKETTGNDSVYYIQKRILYFLWIYLKYMTYNTIVRNIWLSEESAREEIKELTMKTTKEIINI